MDVKFIELDDINEDVIKDAEKNKFVAVSWSTDPDILKALGERFSSSYLCLCYSSHASFEKFKIFYIEYCKLTIDGDWYSFPPLEEML